MGLYVAVFFLLLLLSALDIPFIVRYGAKKGSIIKLIYMLSLAILFTVIFAMVLPETIRDRLIQKAIDLYHGQVSTGLLLAVGLSQRYYRGQRGSKFPFDRVQPEDNPPIHI